MCVCVLRELALLLVKLYHDDVHLLKLLNGEEEGDQRGTEILFRELIKRMPGVENS